MNKKRKCKENVKKMLKILGDWNLLKCQQNVSLKLKHESNVARHDIGLSSRFKDFRFTSVLFKCSLYREVKYKQR